MGQALGFAGQPV
jgi:hypothetical protein